MSKYLIPFMLASWLIGLLYGFYYGLNEMWGPLLIYLYLMIIILIVLIGIKLFRFQDNDN